MLRCMRRHYGLEGDSCERAETTLITPSAPGLHLWWLSSHTHCFLPAARLLGPAMCPEDNKALPGDGAAGRHAGSACSLMTSLKGKYCSGRAARFVATRIKRRPLY